MAATTTPSISSLVKRLQVDFSDYSFVAGERFAWNPVENTVYYQKDGEVSRLLHELGHATLHHQSYRRDVELVRMEADAWHTAHELAANYAVPLPDEHVEAHMDTYREWLHARSTCPKCETTGLQITEDRYQCPECFATWRVNEARTCGLKRYTESKNAPS